MYEMKMSNLLADVEIFSLCRKETLFQAEFQQYKWKSWSSFHIFGGFLAWGAFDQGFFQGVMSKGFCPGVYVPEPQGAHVPIFVHISVVNCGLLHENMTTLAYFVFLGDRSSALSLSVGFSDGLAFARYL